MKKAHIGVYHQPREGTSSMLMKNLITFSNASRLSFEFVGKIVYLLQGREFLNLPAHTICICVD